MMSIISALCKRIVTRSVDLLDSDNDDLDLISVFHPKKQKAFGTDYNSPDVNLKPKKPFQSRGSGK